MSQKNSYVMVESYKTNQYLTFNVGPLHVILFFSKRVVSDI